MYPIVHASHKSFSKRDVGSIVVFLVQKQRRCWFLAQLRLNLLNWARIERLKQDILWSQSDRTHYRPSTIVQVERFWYSFGRLIDGLNHIVRVVRTLEAPLRNLKVNLIRIIGINEQSNSCLEVNSVKAGSQDEGKCSVSEPFEWVYLRWNPQIALLDNSQMKVSIAVDFNVLLHIPKVVLSRVSFVSRASHPPWPTWEVDNPKGAKGYLWAWWQLGWISAGLLEVGPVAQRIGTAIAESMERKIEIMFI